uniref:Uncharacterized protein n=1 Tax=Clastoptera arizonana TaxID=38151 RepID=A0A1B6C8Y5_9HEMI
MERRSLSELNMQGLARSDEEPSVDITAASNSAPVTVTSVVPFHYLINEQAKSIVALQELQNEVSALLEFRDLVMETFPHLRQKMVSSTAPPTPSGIRQYHQNTISQIPLTASLQGSPNGKTRDWEPGVRVKRKLHQNSREQETSVPSLIPRSRSNSHGKAPKSGEVGNSSSSTGSSAVQDSGFCTESKEHCSTSSGATNSTSRKTDPDQEADDELWNLLDLIHRKGTKLRLEVEYLQQKFDKSENNEKKRRTKSLSDLTTSDNNVVKSEGVSVLDIEVEGLRRERDLLLDRVTEMEAENLANLTQTNHLLAEIGVLNSEKRDLEDQLRTAIVTKAELNSRIHDLHLQFVNRSENKYNRILYAPIAKGDSRTISNRLASSQVLIGGSSCFTPVKRSLSNEDSVCVSDNLNTNFKEFTRHRQREDHPNRIKRTSKDLSVLKQSGEYSDDFDGLKTQDIQFRLKDSPKIEDSDTSSRDFEFSPKYSSSANAVPIIDSVSECAKCIHVSDKLGTLDGIISSPSTEMKGIPPDKEKVAAILKEHNVVELQRHLLTTTYENKIFQCKVEKLTKSRMDLMSQVDKIKEENEDLRFQLEEKSIELEGTRARIRLLERLQSSKLSSDLVENIITHSHTLLPVSHDSTPNPILTHLALPSTPSNEDTIHHSSSTESAHNDDIQEKRSESPRKRAPSKIPLKSYSAPKPPSGRLAIPRNSSNSRLLKDNMSSLGKKEKEKTWDPISRSMKESSIGSKRESPIGRPSKDSLKEHLTSVNRRTRKISDNRLNQDVSFSSTNSTPSMRRDPPSSPAPKKIPPQRERIITSDQNEAKVRPKLSFWSNWLRMSGPS